jgi:hypothetical protein
MIASISPRTLKPNDAAFFTFTTTAAPLARASGRSLCNRELDFCSNVPIWTLRRWYSWHRACVSRNGPSQRCHRSLQVPHRVTGHLAFRRRPSHRFGPIYGILTQSVSETARALTVNGTSSDGPALASWFCGSCTRQPATLLCATAARLRADLAVRLRMPRALHAAGLADIRTHITDAPHILARHVSDRQSANRRAVEVEANAIRHHLHVVLLQTRDRAVVASIGTRVTGLDARLIALGLHCVAP